MYWGEYAACIDQRMERVLMVVTESVLTDHLEVIDAGVDSSQHLLPLQGRLRTRVQRRTEPGGRSQRCSQYLSIHNTIVVILVLLVY